MFIDTDLLRCGAEFSRSAGAVALDGANRFATAQLPAGMFGDFAAAEDFHGALGRAHEGHVTSMQGHQTALDALAEKAHHAAATFVKQDEESGVALDAAGRNIV
jgi:hypothetical protein